MKKIFLPLLKVFFIISLFFRPSYNQIFGKPTNENKKSYETWLGPTIGLGIISGDDFLSEGLHSGATIGLKGGIATRYDNNFRLHGNIVLYHSRIDVEADKNMFEPEEDIPSYIVTTYGEAEVIASFQRNNFCFGPILSAAFGTDTSFSPSIDERDSPNFFLGAGFKHHKEVKKSIFQSWGLSALFDINIAERDIFFLRLSFEFGKDLSVEPEYIVNVKEKKIIKEKKIVKYRTRYKNKIKKVIKIKNNYVVDAGVINFETDKHDLKQPTKDYLSSLASYLNTNLKKWDHLKIKAYTDKRGSFQYNEKLARRRAEAVISILVKGKLPKNRLKSEIKTFEQPVETGDTPLAFARNRRVELSLNGSSPMEPIKQNILLLQQKYRVPPTCSDNKHCK